MCKWFSISKTALKQSIFIGSIYYILYASSSASEAHVVLITLPPTARVRWIPAHLLSKWDPFPCAGILGQAATCRGLTGFWLFTSAWAMSKRPRRSCRNLLCSLVPVTGWHFCGSMSSGGSQKLSHLWFKNGNLNSCKAEISMMECSSTMFKINLSLARTTRA